MTKYWIVVASKDHVLRGVKEGFCQACHGKKAPLARMNEKDWVVFYSSKKQFGKPDPLQSFTAIGQIKDGKVYEFQMSDDFIPWRRNVTFYPCNEVPIKDLIPKFSFIKDKSKWGAAFRYGFLQIPSEDFQLILNRMLVNKEEITKEEQEIV